jgi:poly(A) polymerase
VITRLERFGLKAVPTGIAHGTVTAVSEGRPYEITTLRRDVETFGRHAKVAFTDDWREDAARRDFTINALSCRPDGTLFDYFGGRADLEAGRVRFVGDPEARISEDVLRLLRFYRFFAHYGRDVPDPPARAACRRLAHRLPALSGERLREETLKLLRAPAPHEVLALMQADGVLQTYLPQATALARLATLVAIERRLLPAAPADALRRLAALFEAGADVDAVAARLRLSNRDRDRLSALLAGDPAFDLETADARPLFYRFGATLIRDRALLAAAARNKWDAAALSRLLAAAAAWKPVRLPVNGGDVLALGLEQGEAVGAALRQLEEWWIAREFQPDREAALAQLRKIAARLRGT